MRARSAQVLPSFHNAWLCANIVFDRLNKSNSARDNRLRLANVSTFAEPIDERIRTEPETKIPHPNASFSKLVHLTAGAYEVTEPELVQIGRHEIGGAEVDLGVCGTRRAKASQTNANWVLLLTRYDPRWFQLR
jgi:hypothetical protein